MGCCDLQNSWDEVTRKSHYPVSFPAAQQIPGFLQHSPRYKVETGKINTQKETSRMLQGHRHCPASSRTTGHFVLVEAASGEEGCWGCSGVGRSTGSTGSYPWPAETDDDEILFF